MPSSFFRVLFFRLPSFGSPASSSYTFSRRKTIPNRICGPLFTRTPLPFVAADHISVLLPLESYFSYQGDPPTILTRQAARDNLGKPPPSQKMTNSFGDPLCHYIRCFFWGLAYPSLCCKQRKHLIVGVWISIRRQFVFLILKIRYLKFLSIRYLKFLKVLR